MGRIARDANIRTSDRDPDQRRPDGIDLAFTALLAQRLAVIAGAGLSMAAPSHLPSAAKLAERAKAIYGVQSGAAKQPLPDNIEAQAEFFFGHNKLQTVYLATLIDRHAFAGRPQPRSPRDSGPDALCASHSDRRHDQRRHSR